jgi:cytochrome c553
MMEKRSMNLWKTAFGSTAIGSLTLAMFLTLTGCGGGEAAADGTDSAGGGESTAGGESAGGETGTGGGEMTAASPEMIAAGGARFAAVCGLCHGETGEEGDDGPAIKDLHWAEARMRAQVRNGSDSMRPISAARLSDEDLTKVIAWLGTIGAVN